VKSKDIPEELLYELVAALGGTQMAKKLQHVWIYGISADHSIEDEVQLLLPTEIDLGMLHLLIVELHALF